MKKPANGGFFSTKARVALELATVTKICLPWRNFHNVFSVWEFQQRRRFAFSVRTGCPYVGIKKAGTRPAFEVIEMFSHLYDTSERR